MAPLASICLSGGVMHSRSEFVRHQTVIQLLTHAYYEIEIILADQVVPLFIEAMKANKETGASCVRYFTTSEFLLEPLEISGDIVR